MRSTHAFIAAAVVLGVAPTRGASAQAAVLVSEIIPAVAGTELGSVEVRAAPPLGESVVVRRAEVLAALARAGRSARGLAIPRATRVERAAHALDANAITALVRARAAQSVSPCTLVSLEAPTRTITASRRDVEVEVSGPRTIRDGRVTLIAVLRDDRDDHVLSLRALVECPPPVVEPGATLRIAARVGAVAASTSGEALERGRVGDIIQVRTAPGGALVRARVLDASSAEVVR